MCVGNKDAIVSMYEQVLLPRIKHLTLGIPKEVRQALPDGNNSFLRHMPGAARMYPETDIPLIYSNMQDITLPETLDIKTQRYQNEYGLQADLAKTLAYGNFALFEECISRFKNIKIGYLADVLLSAEKDARAKLGKDVSFLDSQFLEVLEKLDSGIISKDVLGDIFVLVAQNKKVNYDNYKAIDDTALKQIIKQVVLENKGAPMGALMGKAMEKLRGKADGKKISEILKECI